MGRHYSPKWVGAHTFAVYMRSADSFTKALKNRFNIQLEDLVDATWQYVYNGGQNARPKTAILKLMAKTRTQELFLN